MANRFIKSITKAHFRSFPIGEVSLVTAIILLVAFLMFGIVMAGQAYSRYTIKNLYESEAVSPVNLPLWHNSDDASHAEDASEADDIKVWTGDDAFLKEFSAQAYQAALKENKLIVLYFDTNWCVACRAEFRAMIAVFDQVKPGQVIGFRVNYNDNQMDSAEQDLAARLGVVHLRTKIIIKNGKPVLVRTEPWDANRYVSEISKIINRDTN